MASSLQKSQFFFLLFILTLFSIKVQAEVISYEELNLDVFNLESEDLALYEDLEDDTGDKDIRIKPKDGEAHCVWYGKCVLTDGSNKTVPCADNHKARPVLNNTKWDMLAKYCEDFLIPSEGEVYPAVCCSFRTLAMLNVQLSSYEGLLNRCPSCWSNYRKFYCTLNCAPNQSDYMLVKRTADAEFKAVTSPTAATTPAPAPTTVSTTASA